jgi:hypothetical protein
MLLGLWTNPYTAQNFYDSLTHKSLSSLSVIGTPIALLGTSLARTGRARLAWAAVVVGTAIIALLTAVGLGVIYGRANGELVIQGAAAIVISGLAAILAVQAYRRIAPSSARPALVTTILVWVLVIAAFAAFMPMRALTDWPAYVAVLWLVATLSLVVPFAPGTRIAVGAVVLGAMLTIVLYFLGPEPPQGTVPIVAGCLVIAIVTVVHLRPVYLSLRDRSPAPGS